MSLFIIVAMSENGVIGDSSNTPLWRLGDDLAFFKKITITHSVIMGRKTYETINHPLIDRENIVLSHNQGFQAAGCLVSNSLEDAIKHTKYTQKVFIIGGGEVYKQSLPLVNEMYLTLVQANLKGDVSFNYNPNEWRVLSTLNHQKDSFNNFDFSIKHLQRI